MQFSLLTWLSSGRWMRLPPPSFFAMLGVLCLLLPAGAEAQLHITPHPNSKFWIHGNATVRNFTCVVDRVEGEARLPRAPDTISTASSESSTQVAVQVPVEAVDCGNSRMTEDLQETLQMKEHPEIRFELIHATMGAQTDTSAQWRRVDAVGPLTIAGTKRLIRLGAAARALDENHFRLRGCLPVRMTYFNIEPPTKAFGLIKVKNRVEVQFDLLARTTSTDQTSPFDTLSLNNPPSCDE